MNQITVLKRLFVAILLSCYNAISFAQAVKVGDIYYLLSGDEAEVCNKYGIAYVGGAESYPESKVYSIPSTISYQGLTFTVTSIGESAFGVGPQSDDDYQGSKATGIKLPTTLKTIKKDAFHGCTHITEVLIPGSVEEMGRNAFDFCSILRTLIYVGEKSPSYWTATSKTYVPDIKEYSNPTYNINNAKVIEMISFKEDSFVYTGNAPTTTWKNNVEGYNVNLTMPTLEKNAGEYVAKIPATFSNGSNKFSTNIVYRYKIVPAKLIVKANDASRIYGNADPNFNLSYSGFVNGEGIDDLEEPPIASTTATATSDVGVYPITATGGKANNYCFVYEEGRLTITKATASAKATDTLRLYGSANPKLTLTYTGLKNNEAEPVWITPPTLTTEASNTSPVGTYAINISGGEAKNYDITFSNGLLTITKAKLTVNVNNVSRLYYEQNPDFSYSITGYVNGESESVIKTKPQCSTTATINSNVGTYAITAGWANADNYEFTYNSGNLDIKKRTLQVKARDCSREYNEENPAFLVEYEGFVNGEDEKVLTTKPKVTTNAIKKSDVGSYTLYVSSGEANNYEFTYRNGTLTITKAYQQLTWDQNLNGIAPYSQVRLEAVSNSDLPISYSLDNDTVASLYSIGDYTYLDCFHYGKVRITAQQEGNRNYWPSTRIYKEANVGDYTTGIKDISIIDSEGSSVKVYGRNIIISGVSDNQKVYVYTLSGALVYSGSNGEVKVKNGPYIIKVGGTVKKIIVK